MARSIPLLLVLMLALPSVSLVAVAPAASAAPQVGHMSIPSFDGVRIAATMFVPEGASAANPVPFVLMTHGWGGSRVTTYTGRVAELVDAGYGVLTWDSRGFGASGGEVMLNSPDYEVKDVSVLIDVLARHSFVAKVNGDPLIGMSGGSYAGGIQLLAAAHDSRIDVITPEVTWNNLLESLAPNGVPKAQWVSLLFSAGLATTCNKGAGLSPAPTTGCQTTDLAKYYAAVMATNGVTDEVRDALLARSPSTYMANIRVPTLLVQGWPDTLFDVEEAAANYAGIKANGAPVKLWIHDGGHILPGTKGTFNTQNAAVGPVVVAWLDCYLKPVADCTRVGPEVEHYGPDGVWRSAASYPLPQTAMAVHVNGIPPLLGAPAMSPSHSQWTITLLSNPADGAPVLAVPGEVSLRMSSLAPEFRLFVTLGVRNGTTVTPVSLQTTALRGETLLATPAEVTESLVDVLALVNPGESLVLHVSTWDARFSGNRAPASVSIEDIDVTFGALTGA